MPSINFKGKNAVWNHHLSVPYQILKKNKKLSMKGKNEEDNLIIEADNLIALKSLLPKYQGEIKCVYIDPPYNNGGEGWIYNDNVNSPLIRAWLGKTVDNDDLTKHDRWLCMMTPRLKLLKDLLKNDGVIFISIDNNEVHHLRMLLNDIFGEDNFIGMLKWKKKKQPSYMTTHIAEIMEYILVFSKNKSSLEKLSIKTRSDENTRLDNANNAITKLKIKKGIRVKLPQTVKLFKAGKYKIKTMEVEYLNDIGIQDGRTLNDVYVKARFRNNQEQVDLFCEKDCLFITSRNGLRRDLLSEEKEVRKSINDLLLDWGDNQESDKEIKGLFPDVAGAKVFDYPKPSKLIKNLIKSLFSENEIVLDSFAGSGTTAQAVLELNREDGGNRKFILVQLPEKINEDKPAYKMGFRFVHEITRERVKRVIEKGKIEVGFSYMKLGTQIDADSILSGSLPTYKEFAKYVYYLATGKTMDNERAISEKDYFVGRISGKSIYLIYAKDQEKLKNLAITLDWAEKVNKKDNGKKITYAPACFLDEEFLEIFNVQFVSIPYNLFEKSKI